MKVFHHNDNDGNFAAAVLYNFMDFKAAKYVEMDYGKIFPIDSIQKDEIVYILDFSIEINEMKQLLDITKKIVYIDHHKSAIEKLNDFSLLDGVRDTNRSATYLTYLWYIAHSKVEDKTIPLFIKLIDDFDMWKLKIDGSKDFNVAMIAEEVNPKYDIKKLLDENVVKQLIDNGKQINQYLKVVTEKNIKENGMLVEFEGYKNCWAVNGDVKGSTYFELTKPDSDIWIDYKLIPDETREYDKAFWSVSLYSKNIDVSEIASKFEFRGKKGGGHRGAAGFCTETLDFGNKNE